jgi:hypothetical protein
MNEKKQSMKILSAAIIAMLLFSAVFLWVGTRTSTQAEMPTIAGVAFDGEYKIGEGEWMPLTKGEQIPADKGDVTLRGIFIRRNPETGEPMVVDVVDADGNPEYTYSLRYEEFIALNTHMIQKLRTENTVLKFTIADLEKRLSKLEQTIDVLGGVSNGS